MQDILAEQLLGHILEWPTETAKEEIANLRNLSAVKYDGYRNYKPGYRFLESLGLWLRNFSTVQEKQNAYNFIKNRLIYFSEVQMDHLVELLYSQRIDPILIRQTSLSEKIPVYQVRKIKNSESYITLKRQTLFLGMSDGARMDAFRRKNLLSNEQVCVSYELSLGKINRLYEDLNDWIKSKNYKKNNNFKNIFLIDDFSGSGNSILRIDNKIYKGKLSRFFSEFFPKLKNNNEEESLNIFLVTYVATNKSIIALKERTQTFLKKYNKSILNNFEILDPLQLLDSSIICPQINSDIDKVFEKLLIKYYDERVSDENTRTGGPDVIHGYANCGLPLVLCHNCPNNSVYLLWGQTEKSDSKEGLNALFPRISRHLESKDK